MPTATPNTGQLIGESVLLVENNRRLTEELAAARLIELHMVLRLLCLLEKEPPDISQDTRGHDHVFQNTACYYSKFVTTAKLKVYFDIGA